MELTADDFISIIKCIIELDGFDAAYNEYKHLCEIFATFEGWHEMAIVIRDYLIDEKHKQLEERNDNDAKIAFNGNVTYNAPVQFTNAIKNEEAEKCELSRKELAKAVFAVQRYMWGSSAYAVLFCELRDHRGYQGNMAQFERDMETMAKEMDLDWQCKAGTISDAFRNNPYMEKNVDRWVEMGVKDRAITLLRKFQKELS